MEPVYSEEIPCYGHSSEMFEASLQAGSKTITNLFLVPPWSSGTD